MDYQLYLVYFENLIFFRTRIWLQAVAMMKPQRSGVYRDNIEQL